MVPIDGYTLFLKIYGPLIPPAHTTPNCSLFCGNFVCLHTGSVRKGPQRWTKLGLQTLDLLGTFQEPIQRTVVALESRAASVLVQAFKIRSRYKMHQAVPYVCPGCERRWTDFPRSSCTLSATQLRPLYFLQFVLVYSVKHCPIHHTRYLPKNSIEKTRILFNFWK